MASLGVKEPGLSLTALVSCSCRNSAAAAAVTRCALERIVDIGSFRGLVLKQVCSKLGWHRHTQRRWFVTSANCSCLTLLKLFPPMPTHEQRCILDLGGWQWHHDAWLRHFSACKASWSDCHCPCSAVTPTAGACFTWCSHLRHVAKQQRQTWSLLCEVECLRCVR